MRHATLLLAAMLPGAGATRYMLPVACDEAPDAGRQRVIIALLPIILNYQKHK